MDFGMINQNKSESQNISEKHDNQNNLNIFE